MGASLYIESDLNPTKLCVRTFLYFEISAAEDLVIS